MGVCNLFNTFTNSSGNFLMFSQYVEDITRNYTIGDNWKVVPTGFVALNIDYSSINASVNPNNISDLNVAIPKYFQNYFENGCAYGRGDNDDNSWTPIKSRNLFWNSLFNGGFISVSNGIIPQVVYYGDVNMHSYNEHQGMGYGEIYCYIPSDAPRMKCSVNVSGDNAGTTIEKEYLEGFDGNNDYKIDGYSKVYFYGPNYLMPFDNSDVGTMNPGDESEYDINTIVVLYSIFVKENDNWREQYKSIPLGMYVAGKFNANNSLTNPIRKHVDTSYGSGTAYGLRICTRLSATSNGKIVNTDIIADDSGYANMCQMMTLMNDNLAKMMDIVKSSHDTAQEYKETLAIIKNNRTNVPYVKTINNKDYWFVNGRCVGAIDIETNINVECNHECDGADIDYALPQEVIDMLSSDNTNDSTE